MKVIITKSYQLSEDDAKNIMELCVLCLLPYADVNNKNEYKLIRGLQLMQKDYTEESRKIILDYLSSLKERVTQKKKDMDFLSTQTSTTFGKDVAKYQYDTYVSHLKDINKIETILKTETK